MSGTAARKSSSLGQRSWGGLPLLLWLLLVLGLVVRLVFALLPLDQLLILLEDDAWMVAAIARNFALGRGITADGANPTNGFHPLYPLTVGAIPYLLAPQALDAGFRVNLIFCALIGAAATVPLFRLTRRFAGERGALLAVALYTLNPYFARVTVNAMDTALGLLFLLLLADRFFHADLQRWAPALGLGLLAGLAGLARLDNWILAAALGLALLWEVVRHRAPWAALAAYGGGVLLLACPYFAANQLGFGGFFPSSGRALAYMHSYVEGFSLTNVLHFVYLNPALNLGFLPATWLALVLAAVLVALFFRALPPRVHRPLLPLAGYALVEMLYYAYLQQNSNPRYFVGLAALFCLLVGCLFARLEQGLNRNLRLAVLLVVVLSGVGLNTYEVVDTWQHSATLPQLTQPAIYEAALWVRDSLPGDVLLAAKNSGILQYYSGHVVLNVDGKLNAEIVPVLEGRRLLPYLQEKGVTYLVGRERAIAGHVTLYSEEFGPWPAHREITLLDRVRIYFRLLFSRVGLGEPPVLDDASGFRPDRPFAEEATIVHEFFRPNTREDPVVVYDLRD